MPNYKNRRKSPRVYDLKPTTIMLKNHPFRVNDISNEGIGLIMERDGPRFINGERIETIPIPLSSGEVKLEGVVTHVSVTKRNTVFGIRFLFRGEDFKSIIRFKEERTNPPQE